MDDGNKVDVQSDEFKDDSSTALGLGHHASKSRSGGASKFFEEQEREHRRLQTEEMARQGITDPTKVVPSNAGAYDPEDHPGGNRAADRELLEDSIENIMGTNRRVHAGGGGGNVTKIIRTPITETCPACLGTCVTSSVVLAEVRKCPLCKRCKGAGTIVTGWKQEQVQLMGAKPGGGGGGSGSKMKPGKGKRPPFDAVSSSGGAAQLSEVDRARFALAENNARLDRGTASGGRPLKGQEPRMRVQARVEPQIVVDFYEWTGKSMADLLEEMHALLAMARSGAERQVILARLDSLLSEMEESA